MSLDTWSERYAVAAVLVLLFAVLLNNALVMLAVSLAGLLAGFLVARQGSVRRAAVVAVAGFAVAGAIAVLTLLR